MAPLYRKKIFSFWGLLWPPHTEMKYIITPDFVQMPVLIMSHIYTHQDSIKIIISNEAFWAEQDKLPDRSENGLRE